MLTMLATSLAISVLPHFCKADESLWDRLENADEKSTVGAGAGLWWICKAQNTQSLQEFQSMVKKMGMSQAQAKTLFPIWKAGMTKAATAAAAASVFGLAIMQYLHHGASTSGNHTR